jgi:hypothetical protein
MKLARNVILREKLHELKISAVFSVLRAAVFVEQWAGHQFKRLIGQRSLGAVARMERERGLR